LKLRYLLDTNILSEPLKPKSHEGVVKRLSENRLYIATAAPVIYEIVQGVYGLPESKKRAEILRYLEEFVYPNVPILSYNKEIAILHGELQGNLSRIGKKAPDIDGQIAAISQQHQLILVTRNVVDFRNFSALTVENWFELV